LKNIRAVCFDLDGTLLDTLEEIAVSANAVLERNGYPTHDVESYRYHVGDGVRRLVERVVPEALQNEALVSDFAKELEAEYDRRGNRLTRIYAGIQDLLTGLSERGIPMAVLSNKPHLLTVDCMKRFFPAFHFQVVLGQQAKTPRKPDPAGAIKIAGQLGCQPAEILYVGDTDVDMKTAKAANMIAVGVLWGFRSRDELLANGADHLVETPKEILRLVEPS
jgi:phosphoglycolate phosphatase